MRQIKLRQIWDLEALDLDNISPGSVVDALAWARVEKAKARRAAKKLELESEKALAKAEGERRTERRVLAQIVRLQNHKPEKVER